MEKSDFISAISSMFDEDIDDELVFFSHDMKITFDDDNTFNISCDFYYPSRDCKKNFDNEYLFILQDRTTLLLTEKFTVTLYHLNRKDVSWLFCSNFLTPDLINKLESKNTKIVYYGKVKMDALLLQYPDLVAKYKLLGCDEGE